MTRRTILTIAAFIAYVGSVLFANWLVQHYGLVDVMPGPATVLAPAAVYAIGFALVARDMLHDLAGAHWRLWVGSGIAVGTILSAAVASPRLVVASAVAFAASETADLAVYRPLRESGWTLAAAVSSAVGLVVDSLLFLWIAFGSLAFLPGQIVGKSVAVAIAVTAGALTRPAWATA